MPSRLTNIAKATCVVKLCRHILGARCVTISGHALVLAFCVQTGARNLDVRKPLLDAVAHDRARAHILEGEAESECDAP